MSDQFLGALNLPQDYYLDDHKISLPNFICAKLYLCQTLFVPNSICDFCFSYNLLGFSLWSRLDKLCFSLVV